MNIIPIRNNEVFCPKANEMISVGRCACGAEFIDEKDTKICEHFNGYRLNFGILKFVVRCDHKELTVEDKIREAIQKQFNIVITTMDGMDGRDYTINNITESVMQVIDDLFYKGKQDGEDIGKKKNPNPDLDTIRKSY